MARNGFRLPTDRRRRRSARNSGFTLLEAIIAIVMFTFIMLAVSQAFQISLQSAARSQRRESDDGTVRAIFDVITKDILAAYASPNSPTSVFMTSSSSSGSMAPGDLAAFTALATRLQTPELDAQTNGSSGATAQGGSQPQSDMAFVRYNFDRSTGTLYRMINSLPGQQNMTPTAPTPDQALAQNLVSVDLAFWDGTQQSWRNDWDFEQQNQIGVIPLSSGTSSSQLSGAPAGAATTPQGSQGTPNTTATGDTYLPSAVKVTVTLQLANGQTKDYVTTIPLGASQSYLDPNKTANVNTYPPTTAGTSTATSGP
ncbi:MAG: prepilin-type N-terminal cleavage/methylation domain [Chthonomonadaceae bacterium]|nr:prepilin-type N-terminal cleavage/methylation domain [Chthonomonadaceae bacterium]